MCSCWACPLWERVRGWQFLAPGRSCELLEGARRRELERACVCKKKCSEEVNCGQYTVIQTGGPLKNATQARRHSRLLAGHFPTLPCP